MKREGLKKRKCTIHGHNDCGICTGHFKSKAKIKQELKTEINKEVDDLEKSESKKL